MSHSVKYEQKPENWKKIVRLYSQPDHKKSWLQFANSFIPYLVLWIVAYNLDSYFYTFLVCAILPAFITRLFIIMHDCGHGSFHKSKKVRTFLGYITGIMTFTPYWQWTNDHAIHHQHSGNLDKRGFGDVWTLTTKEYDELSTFEKFQYRLYRFPLVTFIIGPFYIFFLSHRVTQKHDGAKERRSVHITNLALVLLYGSLFTFLDPMKVFFITAVSFSITHIFGVWLFYVQHQYEGVYWRHQDEWNYFDSAIKGSSFYKLPKVLQWASGNIGFHHLHHLSHLIPNYKLQQAHEENELFHECTTITFFQSLKSIKLHLIDLENQTLISFKQHAQTKKSSPFLAKECAG